MTEEILQAYFEVLDDILEVAWQHDAMKGFAFFLILTLFMRLMGYLSMHPRISLISRTITTAADDMLHFFLVSSILFGALAWLAQWSFGGDSDAFATFDRAVRASFRMLVGDFNFIGFWREGILQMV